MANRIFIGDRGDGLGIWVSRPGFNVLTATMYDLLLDSSRQMITFVQSGAVTLTKDVVTTLTVTDLGYKPFLIGYPEVNLSSGNIYDNSQNPVYWKFTSNSTVDLLFTTTNYSSTTFRYAIFGVSSG